jgi:hypothetical protein
MAALRFTPRFRPNDFKSFFSGPEGWGSLRQTRLRSRAQRNEITVAEGKVLVSRLDLDIDPASSPMMTARVMLDGKPLTASTLRPDVRSISVRLADRATIRAGKTLTVELSGVETK